MSKEPLTEQEKKRLLLIIIGVGVVFFATQQYFFPWLENFSETATCRNYYGANGAGILFLGLTVISILFEIGAAWYLMKIGGTAIRNEQFPPPRKYLIQPRRYQYGTVAKLRGWAAIGLVESFFLYWLPIRLIP